MKLEKTWLRGRLDDPLEEATLAAAKITLGNKIITRNYDHRAGGERDYINVPLYPLALFIAEHWWPLLYGTDKSRETFFSMNHYIDSAMKGFSFPGLTAWSSGDDDITVRAETEENPFQIIEFFTTSKFQVTIPREDIEENFYDLISSVLSRLGDRARDTELERAWSRVLHSRDDSEERAYCIAAGRLGIDPYDQDAPDISGFSIDLPGDLFGDLCEASTIDEIAEAADWARESRRRLADFPSVSIEGFGAFPARQVGMRAWDHGYEAARALRNRTRLDSNNPRRDIEALFGDAVSAAALSLEGRHPRAIEGLAGHDKNDLRVALPRVSARHRRSTLCRAAFLAWRNRDRAMSAVTTASTIEQQSSRAFAAELMAPAEWLKQRAGDHGLTEGDVEDIAEEIFCPNMTIAWQAHNHGIPLRGFDLPYARS
ncbi:MAG: hypothetical protein RID91_08365 [Azospirillaceae bacterium]